MKFDNIAPKIKNNQKSIKKQPKNKSRRRDLNPRPADYESAAIPLSHGGAEKL